jgi:hypothetical protein
VSSLTRVRGGRHPFHFIDTGLSAVSRHVHNPKYGKRRSTNTECPNVPLKPQDTVRFQYSSLGESVCIHYCRSCHCPFIVPSLTSSPPAGHTFCFVMFCMSWAASAQRRCVCLLALCASAVCWHRLHGLWHPSKANGVLIGSMRQIWFTGARSWARPSVSCGRPQM